MPINGRVIELPRIQISFRVKLEGVIKVYIVWPPSRIVVKVMREQMLITLTPAAGRRPQSTSIVENVVDNTDN